MTVTIVINLFGNVSVENIVENFKNIGTFPKPINIVISWSDPPSNAIHIVHSLRKRLNGGFNFNLIYLPLPRMGSGKQRDLTLKYVLKKIEGTEVAVFMEEDVVVREAGWLSKLLEVFKKLPSKVAILSLDTGSRLCVDFVTTNIHSTSRRLYMSLTGGSGIFAVRSEALRELLRLGLDTYSPFMYFHWEDMEFVLKLWLLGYVTVSYRGINYIHLGSTSRTKPLHRRYTEYLDPMIAMIVNVPLKFLLFIVPLRVLRDLIKSMYRNEVLLLIRAFLFIVKNLWYIMSIRIRRAKVWRRGERFASVLSSCFK
jgi:GT2 family glycosyltransferase